MAVFRSMSKKSPTEQRQRLLEVFNRVKELIREGKYEKALIGLSPIFKTLTLAEILALDLFDDVVEIVELLKSAKERDEYG